MAEAAALLSGNSPIGAQSLPLLPKADMLDYGKAGLYNRQMEGRGALMKVWRHSLPVLHRVLDFSLSTIVMRVEGTGQGILPGGRSPLRMISFKSSLRPSSRRTRCLGLGIL
jgi:hypothetical protein